MASDAEDNLLLQPDSEDDMDWEEVEVPDHPHLEITIQIGKGKGKDKDANKKKGVPHAERLVRIAAHKIHTVALIVSARTRNQWLNDPLLQARLLSLTPLYLQNAFSSIHKSRVPDPNQRGRMFESAVTRLVDWWANSFFDVLPEGHLRNRTFEDIEERLQIRGLHVPDLNDPEATIDEDVLNDIIGVEDPEYVRSEKSLMKHALRRNGSRDVSAQLFTSLCRALGIPARMVVSIQSVPWQVGIGKPKPKYDKKGKSKEQTPQSGPSDNEPQASSSKAKGKEKEKPLLYRPKLRKTKDKGKKLGSAPREVTPDPLTTPPVFWTEVFSRADGKWLPVDPIRAIVNKRKIFDPTPAPVAPGNPQPSSSLIQNPYTVKQPQAKPIPGMKVENRMLYVLAFEEDGYARDVTRRYARQYSAKIARAQGGNIGGGGRGRQAWWERVLSLITRPYRLHRDDVEDEELDAAQYQEGMPTTLSGFKDHPLYVLARHLKQTETIHPPPPETPEIGKFRGEPVYPRSAVVTLKTPENWLRSTGRMIKEGEQPMKLVKYRAGTINRARELEVLKDELRVAGSGIDGDGDGVGENGEGGAASSAAAAEVMQGLYAFSQTEPYVPLPVVDGVVPKNNFGNLDLYVPSMLPKGGVHIPFKGVAKVARKLGFDFAEAVTGFEFKKRKAFPITEGIVVAAENEATILEASGRAFWQAEQEAEEKARLRREERVLKRWTKLIQGLRIRKRLQEQYGVRSSVKQASDRTPGTSTSANDKARSLNNPSTPDRNPDPDESLQRQEEADDFLAGADKVVQAFRLPGAKNTHAIFSRVDELKMGGRKSSPGASTAILSPVQQAYPVLSSTTLSRANFGVRGGGDKDGDRKGMGPRSATATAVSGTNGAATTLALDATEAGAASGGVADVQLGDQDVERVLDFRNFVTYDLDDEEEEDDQEDGEAQRREEGEEGEEDEAKSKSGVAGLGDGDGLREIDVVSRSGNGVGVDVRWMKEPQQRDDGGFQLGSKARRGTNGERLGLGEDSDDEDGGSGDDRDDSNAMDVDDPGRMDGVKRAVRRPKTMEEIAAEAAERDRVAALRNEESVAEDLGDVNLVGGGGVKKNDGNRKVPRSSSRTSSTSTTPIAVLTSTTTPTTRRATRLQTQLSGATASPSEPISTRPRPRPVRKTKGPANLGLDLEEGGSSVVVADGDLDGSSSTPTPRAGTPAKIRGRATRGRGRGRGVVATKGGRKGMSSARKTSTKRKRGWRSDDDEDDLTDDDDEEPKLDDDDDAGMDVDGEEEDGDEYGSSSSPLKRAPQRRVALVVKGDGSALVQGDSDVSMPGVASGGQVHTSAVDGGVGAPPVTPGSGSGRTLRPRRGR